MIIIEGSDLVGKTTLAKMLCEHPALSGYWYHHLTRPPKSFDYCQGYMNMACHEYVQDRYHMSEPVYACVRGDIPGIDPEQYRIVDAHLRMMGTLTVVIVAQDDSDLRARFNALDQRVEMYHVEQIVHVNALFNSIVSHRVQLNTSIGEYHMDWDIVIRTKGVDDYPSDEEVDKIIDAYIARQATIIKWIGEHNDGPNY